MNSSTVSIKEAACALADLPRAQQNGPVVFIWALWHKQYSSFALVVMMVIIKWAFEKPFKRVCFPLTETGYSASMSQRQFELDDVTAQFSQVSCPLIHLTPQKPEWQSDGDLQTKFPGSSAPVLFGKLFHVTILKDVQACHEDCTAALSPFIVTNIFPNHKITIANCSRVQKIALFKSSDEIPLQF